MKYKTILFDMDGTVLYTLPDLCDSVNYSLAQFGYAPITIEQYIFHVWMFIFEIIYPFGKCCYRNIGIGCF